MKKFFFILLAAVFISACNNHSANNNNTGMDTTNTITLPANRSSDSMAMDTDSTKMKDSANNPDSANKMHL